MLVVLQLDPTSVVNRITQCRGDTDADSLRSAALVCVCSPSYAMVLLLVCFDVDADQTAPAS